MKKISRTELVEMLASRRGATAVTFVAETEPAMLKTGNPYVGRTKKVARVNGMVGWDYERSVNLQRCREEQPLDDAGEVAYFESAPRQWGRRIKGSPFVEHNGKLYLEVRVNRSLGHEYRVDGQTVDPKKINKFLPKRKEGKRQKVTKPVICRDYDVTNLKAIAVGGEHYEIEA